MSRAVASWVVVAYASGARGAFLDDLLELSLRQFPGQPAEVIEAMLDESLASVLEAEGIPTQEVECNRDYSAACPADWVDEGDGSSCTAPSEYTGPCPASMFFFLARRLHRK